MGNHHRSGNSRWVHSVARVQQKDGKTKSISGSFQDITERKLAEQALRESEDRYRSLVDLSPDAVLVDVAGVYVYANSAACSLFGATSSSELIGSNVLKHVHPDDHGLLTERAANVFAGVTMGPHEMRILRLDGTPVYVEALAANVAYDGNMAAQVILRDISERKQFKKALLERDEQLRQSQKMGSGGSTGRRHRSRLQQSTHGHHGV